MKTMKIQPSHKSQGDYVVINADDFDSKTMKEYKPKEASKEAAKKGGK